MISAPLPPNEELRLKMLRAYQILDSEAEANFDHLTKLASHVCQVPIALISLVDENRQWFKSKVGLDAAETGRDVAFCAHAILQDKVFTVPDALSDERFHDNPLVVGGPRVRAYAGAPLINARGQALGTVCVIDHHARNFTEEQKQCLQTIATQAVLLMELRRLRKEAQPRYDHSAGVLAAISHELRTPLNGLLASAEMLLETDLTEEQKQWVEMSRKSSQALLSAVDHLLSLGREVLVSGIADDPAREKDD